MKHLHRLERINKTMKEVFDHYSAGLTPEEKCLRLRDMYAQKTASERKKARRKAEEMGFAWIYDDNWQEEFAARQRAGRIR